MIITNHSATLEKRPERRKHAWREKIWWFKCVFDCWRYGTSAGISLIVCPLFRSPHDASPLQCEPLTTKCNLRGVRDILLSFVRHTMFKREDALKVMPVISSPKKFTVDFTATWNEIMFLHLLRSHCQKKKVFNPYVIIENIGNHHIWEAAFNDDWSVCEITSYSEPLHTLVWVKSKKPVEMCAAAATTAAAAAAATTDKNNCSWFLELHSHFNKNQIRLRLATLHSSYIETDLELRTLNQAKHCISSSLFAEMSQFFPFRYNCVWSSQLSDALTQHFLADVFSAHTY